MLFRSGAFERTADCRIYEYRLSGIAARLKFDIEDFATFDLAVAEGSTVRVKVTDTELTASVTDRDGKTTSKIAIAPDPAKAARQQAMDRYFDGTHFAVPSMKENLPSLSRYFDPPLDYSSIE